MKKRPISKKPQVPLRNRGKRVRSQAGDCGVCRGTEGNVAKTRGRQISEKGGKGSAPKTQRTRNNSDSAKGGGGKPSGGATVGRKTEGRGAKKRKCPAETQRRKSPKNGKVLLKGKGQRQTGKKTSTQAI